VATSRWIFRFAQKDRGLNGGDREGGLIPCAYQKRRKGEKLPQVAAAAFFRPTQKEEAIVGESLPKVQYWGGERDEPENLLGGKKGPRFDH